MLFHVAVLRSFLLGYKIPDLFIHFPVGRLLSYFSLGLVLIMLLGMAGSCGAHH